MAIEGLSREQSVPVAKPSDDIGVAVEALERLGLVADRDRVAETVAADFAALDSSGTTGEKYIALPNCSRTLWQIIAASDSGEYMGGKKYPKTYVYHNLWTPGAHRGGLQAEEIGRLGLPDQQASDDWQEHARLAVHNPASEHEPLLHFLGLAFDEMYAQEGQDTQLQAITREKQAYEAKHPGCTMVPLDAKAVAFIGLMRRIKDETMPVAWGFMRDATLPRKTVGGDSIVGGVRSDGDRLRLDRSYGNAGGGGVGLSAGPKLELQNF